MRYLSTRIRDTKPKFAWTLMALIAFAGAAQDPVKVEPIEASSERAQELVTEEATPLPRGHAALDARRWEQAAAEFRLAVEESPESGEARLGLASALAKLGRTEEAMEQYQRAAEIDPSDAAARLGMGGVLVAEQRLDEALAYFREGVELDPKGESGRLSEVQVLHTQGRFKQVVDRLEEAHEVLPSSVRVVYGLAWMLAASPDASIRDGERAFELAQGVFESHPGLQNAELVAEALAQLDRCAEAAEWLGGIADAQAEVSPAIKERLQRGIDRFAQGSPCRAAVESPTATDE